MKKIILLVILALTACILSVNAAQMDQSGLISVSLVNQDPDPAIVGDIVEVRLGIENIGGKDVNNLMVEFVQEYPFTLVQGEKAVQSIGTIQGYQGVYDKQNLRIVKFKVLVDKDAKAGSYEFKVKYYEQGSTITTQTSLSLAIKSRESAEVIHIDKAILIPGKQTSLKFSIDNVGNSPLRDLTFHWENADKIILPVGSDNTRYINYIEIGESSEIEYKVVADSNAQAGLYKLDLYLTYEDSLTGTTKQVTTLAGIYVGGGTDFDVAFSESANGQISFTIANIGSNPANSVSISIPEQRSWRVTGSNSVIIGNLNKGDYTVASFKLQPSAVLNRTGTGRAGAGAGNQEFGNQAQQRTANNVSSDTLQMQIAYTDTMGERQIIQKEIKLSPQSLTTSLAGGNGQTIGAQGRMTAQNPGFFSKYKWYIAGAAVLLIGYIAHRKYKTKKLANPHLKLKDFFKIKK